jgi:hypothetical protein
MTTEIATAAPAADATSTPADTSAPAATSWSDDAALGAVFDKINAGPEAPEGDPEHGKEPVSADQPQEPVVDPAPVVQAIEPPAAWSAEKKALWPSLSPDAQAYIAERESKAHGQISRQGMELSQLKPIGELRTQYQEVFDRNGVDFVEGFHTIMQMQTLLEKDPIKGLATIAQTFGVDLAKAFGGQAPQQSDDPTQPQQPQTPQLTQLLQKVSQLEGILTEQQRATIAQQTAAARQAVETASQEIAKWSEGKAHFEDVKPVMTKLFESGAADTLDEAYEMAVAKLPDVRQKIEASKKEAEAARLAADQKKAREEQEKTVAAAKRAAKTNGGNRPARAAPSGKWDDDSNLSAIYDQAANG